MSKSLVTEVGCEACGGKGIRAVANGNALRAARILAGCTLRGVAKELGLSAVYLGDIELGRRACPERVLDHYRREFA